MSGTRLLPTPSYPDVLRTAYAWGRVDGLLAADIEPLEGAGPVERVLPGPRCGRLPATSGAFRAEIRPRDSRSTLPT